MYKKNISIMTILLFLWCLSSYTYAVSSSPSSQAIQQTLQEVYQKYQGVQRGQNAQYIPELAKVNPKLFAITVVTVEGEMYSVGDAQVAFPIESITKIFLYTMALQDHEAAWLFSKIGLNATGKPFNSVVAIEEQPHHLQNPLVNAGAIQITSLIKGKNKSAKWLRIFNFTKQLSDGQLTFGTTVYESEMATNQHNRAIAQLLDSYDMIMGSPMDAVEIYTKACSIMATTEQLALMGATFANQGTHPLTKKELISPLHTQEVLAQMVINGLYENSGRWFSHIGVPAKSGISGGILAIIPHKMAIVVFSPPVDEAGNSVRAQLVIEELAKRWHLHILK